MKKIAIYIISIVLFSCSNVGNKPKQVKKDLLDEAEKAISLSDQGLYVEAIQIIENAFSEGMSDSDEALLNIARANIEFKSGQYKASGDYFCRAALNYPPGSKYNIMQLKNSVRAYYKDGSHVLVLKSLKQMLGGVSHLDQEMWELALHSLSRTNQAACRSLDAYYIEEMKAGVLGPPNISAMIRHMDEQCFNSMMSVK